MVPLKDITRVVNGLSLVAKKAISYRSADTLIKGAILSATAADSLTKRSLRPLEIPRTHTDSSNSNSNGDAGNNVVYSDNHNRDNDKDDVVSETLPIPVSDAAVDFPIPSTSNPNSHLPREFDAPSISRRALSAVIDVDGNNCRRKP